MTYLPRLNAWAPASCGRRPRSPEQVGMRSSPTRRETRSPSGRLTRPHFHPLNRIEGDDRSFELNRNDHSAEETDMYYTDDSILPENMAPLIITAAPYGPEWIPGDADIPVTWDEQVQAAVDCYNAGAT